MTSLDANVAIAIIMAAIILAVILARVSFWVAIRITTKVHLFHKKKWVLVYRCYGPFCPGMGIEHMHPSEEEVQVGRWVCAKEGCTAMGEECLGLTKKSVLTIHNGNLVPDEKAWSNPPKN